MSLGGKPADLTTDQGGKSIRVHNRKVSPPEGKGAARAGRDHIERPDVCHDPQLCAICEVVQEGHTRPPSFPLFYSESFFDVGQTATPASAATIISSGDEGGNISG